MQTNPKETVDAWIAQDIKLDPVQLIPALVQYDANKDPRQVSFFKTGLKKAIVQFSCINVCSNII